MNFAIYIIIVNNSIQRCHKLFTLTMNPEQLLFRCINIYTYIYIYMYIMRANNCLFVSPKYHFIIFLPLMQYGN